MAQVTCQNCKINTATKFTGNLTARYHLALCPACDELLTDEDKTRLLTKINRPEEIKTK